jgi:hypothetical protein
MPRNEKLAAVARSDENLKAAFPHLDAIVVSGLYDPTAVEAELLERLAETVPVLVLVPTTTPETPAMTRFTVPDIDELPADVRKRIDR